MKLLIADAIHDEAISKLSAAGFDVKNSPEISPDELLSTIGDYEGLVVRSRTKVTKAMIGAGKKLKIIARVGTGTDTIDVEAAKEKGIEVINAPGANAQAVAELTLGLMLSLIRKIPFADKTTKEGLWQKCELKGTELNGKTVGIIGYGAIGKKVGTLVEAFGANILTHDRDNDGANLQKLLTDSDIITLHSVLNDETKKMINTDKISIMKKSAFLINCARAEIINEDDLYVALSTNMIKGAALDVFWEEPVKSDSRWVKLDNVILTPHIGGQTTEASSEAATMIADKLIDFKNKNI